MSKLMNLAVFALAASAFSLPARADIQGHCEAYAKDFADANVISKADWQKRSDDAMQACLSEYQPAAVAAPAVEKPKPAKAASQEKPKPQKQPKTVVAEANINPAQEGTPTKVKPGVLEKGSDAWNDYCEKKYVSFNRETGTYVGRSGKERNCLVTQ